MRVLAWSPEKRLLVMFHKIFKWEQRAGKSSAMVTVSPAPLVALPLEPGDRVIGELSPAERCGPSARHRDPRLIP